MHIPSLFNNLGLLGAFYVPFYIDIDECSTKSHSCDVNAVCNDTEGSYMCTCNSGYSGDGKACSGKLNSHKIATYKCFAPEALKGHEIMLK